MEVQYNQNPLGDIRYPSQQNNVQYNQPAVSPVSIIPKKSSGRFLTLILVFVVVVSGVVGGVLYYQRTTQSKSSDVLGVSSNSSDNTWSAIFLINGQVYFGKIVSKSASEIVLDDVYFLRVVENTQQAAIPAAAGEGDTGPQPTPQASPELTIVARANTLHSPNGKMSFNMQNVLFVEDLKPDSKVIEAINTIKKQEAEGSRDDSTNGQ